jgi:hypothetical protein
LAPGFSRLRKKSFRDPQFPQRLKPPLILLHLRRG